MSEASTNTNPETIRRTIRETLRDQQDITVGELADMVAVKLGCPESDVIQQVDLLAEHGFATLSDSESVDTQEVELA